MAFPKEERDELRRLGSTPDTFDKLVKKAMRDLPALLNALDAAEAERDEARSLLLNGIQTNGDSLAFLEHVRREHAAVVSERDALKGQVREWISANGPGGWVDDLRKESGTLKAKLAGIVEALSKIAHPTYGTEIHDTDSERADVYWQHIERFQRTARQALAAAKVQP